MQLSSITPVILTYNEDANIERNLAALSWAQRVVVVDSGSTDQTVALVRRHANAVLFSRPFDSHANQWNYALNETGIDTPWVLVLDADHIVTDALSAELRGLTPAQDDAGFRADFCYCIDGRPLRASIYPASIVLFRRGAGYFVQDGHTQRLVCSGKIGRLQGKLLHDDRKSHERWLQSQARYMTLEAAKLKGKRWSELDWADRLRQLRIVAPPVVLLYCLFGRGLLLDGRAGLRYALQRTKAEAILSMILLRQLVQPARERP
jgi:glycosyltransferase involved in cell wall biosynthesis